MGGTFVLRLCVDCVEHIISLSFGRAANVVFKVLSDMYSVSYNDCFYTDFVLDTEDEFHDQQVVAGKEDPGFRCLGVRQDLKKVQSFGIG